MSDPITVLLAEDHTVVREGLRSLLEAGGDIRVVGEASTGRQAVNMALHLHPDVIVMDIAMPILNGMEATRQIRKSIPDARVIVLSAHNDQAYIDQMMTLGVVGYLLKETSAHNLSRAVREVHQGRSYFSPSLSGRIYPRGKAPSVGEIAARSKRTTLSSREVEVVQLIAEGHANKQIASELGLSVKTIEKHRQRVMEKLDIHDTAGLTRYAIAAGIIESTVLLTIE